MLPQLSRDPFGKPTVTLGVDLGDRGVLVPQRRLGPFDAEGLADLSRPAVPQL